MSAGPLTAAFLGMRPALIGLALACAALLVGVRVVRWGVLVRAVAPVPAVEIGRAGALGFMAIDLFPARLGELVRPALLARRGDVPLGAAVATIVVERLLDLAAVLACLLGALALADLPALPVTIAARRVDLAVDGRNAVLVLLAALGLPPLGLVLLGDAGLRILLLPTRLLPRAVADPIAALARAFHDALRGIGRPRPLLLAAALTALVWLLVNAVCFALIRAVHVDQLGFAESALVVVVVSLSLLLPSPAGGLGVFEAGGVAGLALFGVARPTAAAFAIALHATHVGAAVVIGAIVLARGGLGLRDLWRAGVARD